MARTPGFTIVAVLTLALGIGANTAIFSVIHAVLLRPLAYNKPQQLVAVHGLVTLRGLNEINTSAPEYLSYRDDLPSIEDAAAFWPINLNLTGSGTPERIQSSIVSHNYTDVLGVKPVLGRSFAAQDDGGGLGYVALISYGLWQRRFNGDSAVIGTVVRVDDDPMEIIGVMPRDFRHPLERGGARTEMWGIIDPVGSTPPFINNRRARVFEVYARLKPDATLERAQAELEVLTARFKRDFPDDYPAADGWNATMIPLTERVTGEVRPALLVLLGAVGLVLLIACVNVANLLLSRATARGREIAIRTALGSSRSRLVRQLLTESVVLALSGGVLGVLIAVEGTAALARLAELYLPRAGEIHVSGVVLGFTALLSITTGIAFGLLPALQASRPDLQSGLREGGRGASAGRTRARLRMSLVVAETALAVVLVTGAGLLLRSFERLVSVDPGFEPEQVLGLQVWLAVPNDAPKGRFYTHEQRRDFYSRIRDAIAQTPGVRDAAIVSMLPFRGRAVIRFDIEGRPQAPDAPAQTAEWRSISPTYFATMGIPVLRGPRIPDLRDSASTATVVINETFAEKHFPGENPVGRRIQLGGPQAPWIAITGVVGSVRQLTLETPPREEVYVSYRLRSPHETAFVVRTEGSPADYQAAVLKAIHSVDPEQPVFGLTPMEQLLAEAGAPRRFSLLLITIFAGLALVLSAIGIYGVMAYTTAQRQHEMGIRLALGALPADVLRLIVRQGMRLVAVGLGLGLAGAWALSRVLQGQLFEVTTADPVTYAGAALLLGLVALAANYLPARRASRANPLASIRAE